MSHLLIPPARRRDRQRAREARARWLRVTGALALVVFALAPTTARTGPEGADVAISTQRRAVIYPARPATSGALTFSHARHASTPCTTCHAGATTSARVADTLTPKMDACATCHTATPLAVGEAAARARSAKTPAPAMSDCAACHAGLKAPLKPGQAPPKLVRPPARLKFNHAAHMKTLRRAQVLPLATHQLCVTCHASGAGGEPGLPSMKQCQTCHDGGRASATCTTCHLSDGAGVVQTAFTTRVAGGAPAQSRRATTQVLKPSDHTLDWIKRHGPLSRTRGDACMSCHTEPSCASCHDDKRGRLFKAHPPNYVTIHARAARADGSACASCHKQETFCASCHARTRNMPGPDNSPPVHRAKHHPPGWLDANAPGNHGALARRNVSDCATCHTERDCITCHTAINPHPPAYRMTCASALRSNPTPCARCHTDLSTVRAACR